MDYWNIIFHGHFVTSPETARRMSVKGYGSDTKSKNELSFELPLTNLEVTLSLLKQNDCESAQKHFEKSES